MENNREDKLLKLLNCLTEGDRIIKAAGGGTGDRYLITDSEEELSRLDISAAFEYTLHALLDAYPGIKDSEIFELSGMSRYYILPDNDDDIDFYDFTVIDLGFIAKVREVSFEETGYSYLRWKAYTGYIFEELKEHGLDLCSLSVLADPARTGEGRSLWEISREAAGFVSFDDFIKEFYTDNSLVKRALNDDRLFDRYLEDISAPSRRQMRKYVDQLISRKILQTFTDSESGMLFVKDDWDDRYIRKGELTEKLLANEGYRTILLSLLDDSTSKY